jgi:hypothetical protein
MPGAGFEGNPQAGASRFFPTFHRGRIQGRSVEPGTTGRSPSRSGRPTDPGNSHAPAIGPSLFGQQKKRAVSRPLLYGTDLQGCCLHQPSPGCPVSPESNRLGLLPSDPDPVHRLPPHRTQQYWCKQQPCRFIPQSYLPSILNHAALRVKSLWLPGRCRSRCDRSGHMLGQGTHQGSELHREDELGGRPIPHNL